MQKLNNMQNETKNNPPRKSNRGGARENAGPKKIEGDLEMFRIQRLVPKHLKKEIKIKCNVLINDIMKTLLLLLFVALVGCEVVQNDEEVKPIHTYEYIVSKTGYIGDITYLDTIGKQIHYSNYSANHSGFYQKITTDKDSLLIIFVVSDGGWVTPETQRVEMWLKKDGKTLVNHKFTKGANQEEFVIAKYY